MGSSVCFEVFQVSNSFKPSNLDCESFKGILNQKNIESMVAEHEDGWLIKIPCSPSCHVLAKENFLLLGKFKNNPYILKFEPSQVPFPEKLEVPPHNHTGRVDDKILVTNIPQGTTPQEVIDYFQDLPFGGRVQYIRIGYDMANIAFYDVEVAKRVAEKSPLAFNNCKIQVTLEQTLKTDVLAKEKIKKLPPPSDHTFSVTHGVPKRASRDSVRVYFDNLQSAQGGKIIDIDLYWKDEYKITFASSIGRGRDLDSTEKPVSGTERQQTEQAGSAPYLTISVKSDPITATSNPTEKSSRGIQRGLENEISIRTVSKELTSNHQLNNDGICNCQEVCQNLSDLENTQDHMRCVNKTEAMHWTTPTSNPTVKYSQEVLKSLENEVPIRTVSKEMTSNQQLNNNGIYTCREVCQNLSDLQNTQDHMRCADKTGAMHWTTPTSNPTVKYFQRPLKSLENEVPIRTVSKRMTANHQLDNSAVCFCGKVCTKAT